MIKIKKLTDWDVAYEAALFTEHKTPKNPTPSDSWIAKACLAEHSMIREVRYMLEMDEIPCWVSQHIARHDAFAEHTVRDGAQDQHFVATSRDDRVENPVPRGKMPQESPVDHRVYLSAQDFITISLKRLCTGASPETRAVWREVLAELAKVDPVLASKCVPSCLYRGFCCEFRCCGYADTEAFAGKLVEYRKKSA